MTITVSINGTAISSAIIFVEMSPWKGQPKTKTHEVDGADYDVVIHTGRHSRSTTITGYCKRTAANLAELEKMDTGAKITVTHSVEGTRAGMVTALPVKCTKGGLFVTFTMTVVEQ